MTRKHFIPKKRWYFPFISILITFFNLSYNKPLFFSYIFYFKYEQRHLITPSLNLRNDHLFRKWRIRSRLEGATPNLIKRIRPKKNIRCFPKRCGCTTHLSISDNPTTTRPRKYNRTAWSHESEQRERPLSRFLVHGNRPSFSPRVILRSFSEKILQ